MNRKQSDYLMLIIMIMTVVIVFAASIIKVNSVVHGQGVVIAQNNAQFISLTKGGTIEEIYVSEGNTVKKGDLLATVMNLDLQKEYQRLKTQQDFLVKNIEELSIILNQDNFVEGFILFPSVEKIKNRELLAHVALVNSQIKTKSIKRQALESEIEGLEKRLKGKSEEVALLEEEIDILSPLVKEGISPYTTFLNKKQLWIRAKSEVNDTVNTISLKRNEIELVVNEMRALDNELRLTLSQQLSKDQQDLDIIDSTLQVLNQQIEEKYVRSPVNGIIYTVNRSASTQGGVIQAADLLFEIKPIADKVLAEVKVNPKYRDQIYLNEHVKVDILSIVQAKGKSYEGVIEKISPDSYEENIGGNLQRYYKVTIEFDVHENDFVWLQPGMTVNANIVTGEHSIMEYLISPLLKGSKQIFSEPVNIT